MPTMVLLWPKIEKNKITEKMALLDYLAVKVEGQGQQT